MKHIAKNIYIQKVDQYSYKLSRKYHPKNKEGGVAVDSDGNIKTSYARLGYYSTWDRVWSKLEDLAMEEWVNSDVNACRSFINEAAVNVKSYFNDIK